MKSLRNGRSIELAAVPVLDPEAFHNTVVDRVGAGDRIVALFGRRDASQRERVRLLAVLGNDATGSLALVAAVVSGELVSMTPQCVQASGFEREIAEQLGLALRGHPWPKPIRFEASCRGESGGSSIGALDFFRVEGEEVHEVAVGPVHAGIIEPGHFRFQCHGERVLHLEISLGYQHRGIERALLSMPPKRRLHYVETAAGDTTIGHAMAYCQAIEALCGCQVSARAAAIRAIALELERLANHTGDLGALAGDIAYLPTASYCGRLRGDFLNMTAQLCGSRFGRGIVRPGGVAFDLSVATAQELGQRLAAAGPDVSGAVGLLWERPSVLSRFEGTGVLSKDTCRALGIVGPPARAAGLARDVRQDYASGLYRFAQIPVSTWTSGDVYGRAFVRWLEIQRSMAFVREQIALLPAGEPMRPLGPLAPSSIAVSLVEGWRGEIAHVIETDLHGAIAAHKIVDPSFHNWFGLAMAMRGQEISDFPVCNKSFDLSYCGHDL
jgi:Ni,Fe-hydrogenase III large subunit